MNLILRLLFLLMCAAPCLVFSQTDSIPEEFLNWDNWDNNLENSVENNDIIEEMTDIIYAGGKRLDVNHLTQEEAIIQLQLTEYQYYQLQLYIEKYGQLASLYEIAAIEGFSASEMQRLIPLLMINKKSKSKKKNAWLNAFRYGKSTLLLRYSQILEKRAGFSPDKTNGYLGSPAQLAFRYSFQSANFSAGIAGEKDSGEEFFKGTQKWGFDHYAFHLAIKNISIIKCFVLGDYKLSFGQGIIMGNGILGSKGNGLGLIRKMPSTLQPATPMNETRTLRGTAIHIGNAQYRAIIFYGWQYFDGAIEQSPDGDDLFNGAISTTGLHRTASEIAKKQTIQSHVYGVNFCIQRRTFRIGAQAVNTQFSRSAVYPSELYRKYNYVGINHFNVSTDYQWLIKKCILFGEAAIGKQGAIAFLQGVILELNPKMKLGVLFRHYDKNYIALNGKAFGENGTNNGETGLYFSSDMIIGKKINCNIFSDFYQFSWLRYRVEKPTAGFDCGLRLTIDITRNFRITARYAYKDKEQNGGENSYWREIVSLQRHRARLAVKLRPFSILTLATETDFAANSIAATNYRKFGYLLFQDIAVAIPKPNLLIQARIAYFDTDSYEERLYAYEHDLYYTFTIQSYYYQGWRTYLMLRYSYKFFSIWLRFSQTYYLNRESISSGLDLIDKKHKSDVRIQCMFRF